MPLKSSLNSQVPDQTRKENHWHVLANEKLKAFFILLMIW